ncbi:hypothetical protein FHR81_004093 [Actinoalloteichus hoggarensis]|uniref:Uncharacterized protein n=1 Tax=Actinoalloteichus hoggarensis TaxID=1470176 RepID=A0A221W948_9PSEU|nr:hypothetical protein AHOG_24725 [Actinoalloteichus hoggarensis]MBB5923026.1 hypothetical protein [Actinoalloteichus hoggarensis]
MNMDSLLDWLVRIGVPAQVVSVGAEADDTWCVLREEAPGGETAWEVFWREQGNRYDWARFTNEQVACLYLFGRLAWTQTVRGVIGSPPSTAVGTPRTAGSGSVPDAADSAVAGQPAPAAPAGTSPPPGVSATQSGPRADTAGGPAGQPSSTRSGPVPPAAAGTNGGRSADESDATPPTGIPTIRLSKDAGNSAARLDG